MFEVRCPHCSKSLSIRHRLALVYKLHGVCKFCGRGYLPKRRSMLVSSAVLAVFISLLCKTYYEMGTVSLVILTVVAVFIIQLPFNLFYSLDRLDD